MSDFLPVAGSRRWCRAAASLMCVVTLPLAACEIDVQPLQFGRINPLQATATDSATSLTITCLSATSYTVALGAGSGGVADRQMQSVQGTLAYGLYTDASRNVIWGDGTAGTLTVAGSDDGTSTTHAIYARVPAQPQAEPGVYADTIVVTVSF